MWSVSDQLTVTQEVFLVFFGVYWAIGLGSASRYRLFDTHRLFERGARERAVRRLLIGTTVLMALPLAWFVLLLGLLGPVQPSPWGLFVAALASVSMLGFHRLLHGLIAAEDGPWLCYYDREEWQAVLCAWQQDEEARKPNKVLPHILPAIGYWTVPLMLVWLAR